MNKNHYVVISVDALCASELEHIKTLPHFQSFFRDGSYAKQVDSVYPSLTYTCHTSIITGMYPQSHGIFSNYKFQPFREKPDWHWYAKDIRVKTLVDFAKEKGFKIGNVFWPVMAGNNNIDINCPEVWTNRKDESQIKTSLTSGSKFFQLKMALRFIKYLPGLIGHSQPALDEFITYSACNMIKTYKPNLMLVHLIEHDHEKHVKGSKGGHTVHVLDKIDTRIGEIIDATKKAGIYDDTTFIILGDHSQLTFNKLVNLNHLLEKNKLLQFNENRDLVWWHAYAASQDGSAHIYIRQQDPYVKKLVHRLLVDAMNEPDSGIENIYTPEDFRDKYATDGPYSFIVEAKKGYAFAKDRRVSHSVVEDLKEDELFVSHHGYRPDKDNYQTLFMAKGPGIKEGVTIDRMQIIDIAPTLAELMQIPFPTVDGKIQKEFLKEA